MFIHVKWWSDTPQSVLKYKCLDSLVYELTYAVRKRHAHNAYIRINRIYQYADYGRVENICGKPDIRIIRIIRKCMANSNCNMLGLRRQVKTRQLQKFFGVNFWANVIFWRFHANLRLCTRAGNLCTGEYSGLFVARFSLQTTHVLYSLQTLSTWFVWGETGTKTKNS